MQRLNSPDFNNDVKFSCEFFTWVPISLLLPVYTDQAARGTSCTVAYAEPIAPREKDSYSKYEIFQSVEYILPFALSFNCSVIPPKE
jgi:hypothetical protein